MLVAAAVALSMGIAAAFGATTTLHCDDNQPLKHVTDSELGVVIDKTALRTANNIQVLSRSGWIEYGQTYRYDRYDEEKREYPYHHTFYATDKDKDYCTDDGLDGEFSFLVKNAGYTFGNHKSIDLKLTCNVHLTGPVDRSFYKAAGKDVGHSDPADVKYLKSSIALYDIEHAAMYCPLYQIQGYGEPPSNTHGTGGYWPMGSTQKWTVEVQYTDGGAAVNGKFFAVLFEDIDAIDHRIKDNGYNKSEYIERIDILGSNHGGDVYSGSATPHINDEAANGYFWASHKAGTGEANASIALAAKSGFQFKWHGGYGCATVIGISADVPYGKLKVDKTVDDGYSWASNLNNKPKAGTNTDSLYSLKGATYGVYRDSACTKLVDTLETDENGDTETIELQPGTYYVRETKASDGYRLDTEVYTATVPSDKSTVKVPATETPKFKDLDSIVKKFEEGNAGKLLSGARFRVDYYPGEYNATKATSGDLTSKRHWVIETESDGLAGLAQKVAGTAGGNEFYTNKSGNPIAPLGTYTIKETKAPTGYKLSSDAKTYVFTLTEKTKRTDTTNDVTRSNLNYTTEIVSSVYQVSDPPIRGDIAVIKRDQDIYAIDRTKGDVPEGDGILAGAVFSIVSQNDGTITAPNGAKVSKGGEVCRITTDATGTASTKAGTAVNGWEKPNGWSGAIQYGTYTVTEVTPPTGYRLGTATSSTPWSATVTVTKDGETYTETMTDPIQRGKVLLRKGDIDFGYDVKEPQGDGAFAGAEFSVYNQSENPVLYNNKTVATGKGKAQASWTDAAYLVGTVTVPADDGLAELTNLPYGTYYVKETKAPTGYTLNTSWSKTFTIRSQGQEVSLRGANDLVYDEIIRGDFSLEKIDYDFFKMVTDPEPGYEADAGQRYDVPEGNATLAGAEFKVYNISNHAVKVGDGKYPTLKNSNGSYDIKNDSQACATLTTGQDGKTASVSLPYGTYVVKETKAPSGYLLNPKMAAGIEFTVRSAGDVIITRPDVNDF